MRVKATVDGNSLRLNKPLKFKTKEIDIYIPDEKLEIREKTEGERFLESIWETVEKFPEKTVDWKKQWHEHLEEKYG